jgi:hypothetical protein
MVRKEDALNYHIQERPGKIEVKSTKPCITQRDLSMADRKSLIQGFLAAEVLNAVKDSFVPISGDMKARSTTVPHRGGRLDGELGANWFSGASCSLGRG